MNIKKTTNWIHCKLCKESKKVIAMEFTKDKGLLVIPECQHERYYKLEEIK